MQERIGFPFGLDYGEGIVWQQTEMVRAGSMYGPIDRAPFVVFHYPPAYHATVIALAGIGPDLLHVGRSLSVVCGCVVGATVGLLVYRALAEMAGRTAALIGGLVGSMLLFTTLPFTFWSGFMRVDMMAIAFALLGVSFAGLAQHGQVWLHLGAVCFVISLYTRQTMLAAPAAVFAIALLDNWRRAVGAMMTAGVVGGGIAILLEWWTNGGFFRHIVLYNINLIAWDRISILSNIALVHVIYLSAAILAAWVCLQQARSTVPVGGSFVWLSHVAALYFLLTAFMSVSIVKMGSNLNYFLELMLAVGLLVGLLAGLAWERRREEPVLTVVLMVMLLSQAALLPLPGRVNAEDYPGLRRLAARVAAENGLVISDEMVVLLKAGKSVMWEPAIFHMLAKTKQWDEQLILRMIGERRFGMIVTKGDTDAANYEGSFSPEVARAIGIHYPRREELDGYVVRVWGD